MHKISGQLPSHSHDHSHEADHNHHHGHEHHSNHDQIGKFQYKTSLVVAITFVTMIAEIGFGYASNSLALLADGWHMSSHVLALGMTWFAYFFAKRFTKQGDINQSSKKILSLSGYTSAIILLVVAVIMAAEAIERLLHPEQIAFKEAIFVSFIGLGVNGLSAFLLHDGHEHHDHNIKAAYLHVMADTITSLAAIVSLVIGMYFNVVYLDALSAIVSSIIIVNWAVSLAWTSGKELIGYFRN